MGAFKDKKSGSWYVQFRYTDWQGKRQQKLKRGFATKHEALEWEREFLLQKQTDVTMSFGSFYELYKKDIKPRLKENTWQTKENIIEGKIIPYTMVSVNGELIFINVLTNALLDIRLPVINEKPQ